MEAYIQKKTWTGIFTAALIVAKNKTNQISTHKRMQKKVVIYAYNDNFKRQISDVLHEWISKTLCRKKESRHRRENKKLRYGYGNQSFPKSGGGRGESQGSPGKRDLWHLHLFYMRNSGVPRGARYEIRRYTHLSDSLTHTPRVCAFHCV